MGDNQQCKNDHGDHGRPDGGAHKQGLPFISFQSKASNSFLLPLYRYPMEQSTFLFRFDEI